VKDPNRGQVKAGKGVLIGNAGEYFVMGELLRRGIVAGLAPRNAPRYDIIAINGEKSVNIRVKSRTSAADSWVWMAKRDGAIFGDITRNDLTILVDLKSIKEPVDYFIVDTSDLNEAISRDVADWDNKGHPRNPNTKMRRVREKTKHFKVLMDAGHNNWDHLLESLSIPKSETEATSKIALPAKEESK
jgi:hypothetical protein